MRVPFHYYQQFDADYSRDVPGEGYGGWQTTPLDLDLSKTAVVVMHAWDIGTFEQYPGRWRCVEYIPRSYAISRDVFPKLLGAVRGAGLNLFHVVGGRDYYSHLPGYQRAVKLAGPQPPEPERIAADESLRRLQQFRTEHVWYGTHNADDCARSGPIVDFTPEARPVGDEGVAENAHQLVALARAAGVNHLIYAGFAINWCLLMSPGGMLDLSRQGVMCSAFRQAVTAVENKESARGETHKEEALWRVAVSFGFVFDVDEFVTALGARGAGR